MSVRGSVLWAFLSFILLCLSMPAGAGGLPVSGELPRGMESFDRVFQVLMAKWNLPGGVVVLAKNGKLILARGYGWADRERGVKVDPFRSVFRLASLSKAITAAAVMKLVEQGKLAIDSGAFALLPHLTPLSGQTADPRLSRITVRHLLNHSAGWDLSASVDPMFSTRLIATQAGVKSPADQNTIIRYMMGQPLDFDPGTKYAYSNFGYCVLGRIIEKLSGKSYDAFVRDVVLRPAGISGLALGKTLSKRLDEVTYYPANDGKGESVFDDRPGMVEWPYGGWSLEAMDAHGGWTGSAVDVLRFVLAVDGRSIPTDILSAASTRAMTARPPAPLFQGEAWWYAMGWLVRPMQNDANWWHMGSLDGSTTIMVRACNGLTWVGLFNSRPADHDACDGELDNAFWEAVNGVRDWPAHDLFKTRLGR